MNAAKVIARLALAWIALLAAQMAAGMLVHVHHPPMPLILPWLMLSDAIVAMTLGAAALRSDWRNWKLGLALFAIPAAIATRCSDMRRCRRRHLLHRCLIAPSASSSGDSFFAQPATYCCSFWPGRSSSRTAGFLCHAAHS